MQEYSINQKLNELENRISRIENFASLQCLLSVTNDQMTMAKEGAKGLIEISNRAKGKWRGIISSIEEVRKMRKHHEGR